MSNTPTPLSFSKAFLRSHGHIVFKELAKRNDFVSHHWRIRTGEKSIDVNDWLKPQLKSDVRLDALISAECWDEAVERGEYDYVAREILAWVKRNITYTKDAGEFWQTAKETIIRRRGDCEDGAVLQLILMVKSGIPGNRVRLQWGSVLGGGHAYIIYNRCSDAVEVVLDWTYWYTPILVTLRRWFGYEKNYYEVWGNARARNNDE